MRLTVRAPKAVSDAAHGDSISVSGVCLTVVDQGADWFTADVMKQTLDMSTLAGVAPGRPVNLERATVAHGRLGGHIVQGHIDGTGAVLDVQPGAQWRVLRIGLPAHLAPLVVDKGSIAVDGVSLTVSAVSDAPSAGSATEPSQWFEVSLIPETLEATTLGAPRRRRSRQPRDRHPGAPRAASAFFRGSGRTRAPRGRFHSPASIERRRLRDEPFHDPRGSRGAPRRKARHRRRR